MQTELTYTHPETDEAPDVETRAPRGTNRWLVAAVLILAAALVAMVALWLIDSDEASLTDEQQEMVDTADDVTAALNAGDMELVESFYADRAAFTTRLTDQVVDQVFRAEYFEPFEGLIARGAEFTTDETVMVGDHIVATIGTITVGDTADEVLFVREFSEPSMTIISEDLRPVLSR